MEHTDFENALDLKLRKAARIMRSGGVIICPTEGVYGISARAGDLNAVRRIMEIKKRALNKGLILVADSTASCERIADMSKLGEDSMRLLREKWPGHTTFILPAARDLAPELTGGRGTVAVRVTAFALLSRLVSLTGEPIVSTSANVSGSEPLRSVEELGRQFGDSVDYILDEPCQGLSKPSSIYDAMTTALLRA